jgi:heat shock protein HslJ
MSAYQRTVSLFVLFSLVAAALAACSAPGKGALDLEGSSWKVTEVGGQAVAGSLGVTAEFGSDGKLAGKAPCNSYFADYKQSGSKLTLSMPGATMMYCVDEGVMDLEQVFFQNLEKVRSFTSEADRLILLDESGNSLMVFSK